MAVATQVSCLVVIFSLNIVTTQNVTEDEVVDDDEIVFPGGDEIDAINDIITELVDSEESSISPSNISTNSIIRTTGKVSTNSLRVFLSSRISHNIGVQNPYT